MHARWMFFVALAGCTPAIGSSDTTGSGGATSATSSTTNTSASSSAKSGSTGSGGCATCCVNGALLTVDEPLYDVALHNKNLYVGGAVDSVRAIDACTMSLPPSATASLGATDNIRGMGGILNRLAVAHFTVGSSVVVSSLDPMSLQTISSVNVPLSAGGSWEGATDATSLWLTLDGTGGVLFRSLAIGNVCQYDLGLTTGNLNRGLALWGTIPVVGIHDTPASIATVSNCTGFPTCTCSAPVFSSAFPSGFDPWGIAVSGSKAFVVGILGLAPNAGSAGLYRVDLPTGTIEASFTWDPTTAPNGVDGFTAVTIANMSVVVAGISGGSYTTTNGTIIQKGSAVVLSFPLDFATQSAPTQMTTITDGAPWSIVSDGKSVYTAGVVAGDGTMGFIAKCTADLDCMP